MLKNAPYHQLQLVNAHKVTAVREKLLQQCRDGDVSGQLGSFFDYLVAEVVKFGKSLGSGCYELTK